MLDHILNLGLIGSAHANDGELNLTWREFPERYPLARQCGEESASRLPRGECASGVRPEPNRLDADARWLVAPNDGARLGVDPAEALVQRRTSGRLDAPVRLARQTVAALGNHPQPVWANPGSTPRITRFRSIPLLIMQTFVRILSQEATKKNADARLQADLLEVGEPFLKRVVADGMFHLTSLFLGDFMGNPYALAEKTRQHLMALEHGLAVAVPFFGKDDASIMLLLKHSGGLQTCDRLGNGSLRDTEPGGDIDRTHRAGIGSSEHDHRLKVILMGCRDLFHGFSPRLQIPSARMPILSP